MRKGPKLPPLGSNGVHHTGAPTSSNTQVGHTGASGVHITIPEAQQIPISTLHGKILDELQKLHAFKHNPRIRAFIKDLSRRPMGLEDLYKLQRLIDSEFLASGAKWKQHKAVAEISYQSVCIEKLEALTKDHAENNNTFTGTAKNLINRRIQAQKIEDFREALQDVYDSLTDDQQKELPNTIDNVISSLTKEQKEKLPHTEARINKNFSQFISNFSEEERQKLAGTVYAYGDKQYLFDANGDVFATIDNTPNTPTENQIVFHNVMGQETPTVDLYERALAVYDKNQSNFVNHDENNKRARNEYDHNRKELQRRLDNLKATVAAAKSSFDSALLPKLFADLTKAKSYENDTALISEILKLGQTRGIWNTDVFKQGFRQRTRYALEEILGLLLLLVKMLLIQRYRSSLVLNMDVEAMMSIIATAPDEDKQTLTKALLKILGKEVTDKGELIDSPKKQKLTTEERNTLKKYWRTYLRTTLTDQDRQKAKLQEDKFKLHKLHKLDKKNGKAELGQTFRRFAQMQELTRAQHIQQGNKTVEQPFAEAHTTYKAAVKKSMATQSRERIEAELKNELQQSAMSAHHAQAILKAHKIIDAESAEEADDKDLKRDIHTEHADRMNQFRNQLAADFTLTDLTEKDVFKIVGEQSYTHAEKNPTTRSLLARVQNRLMKNINEASFKNIITELYKRHLGKSETDDLTNEEKQTFKALLKLPALKAIARKFNMSRFPSKNMFTLLVSFQHALNNHIQTTSGNPAELSADAFGIKIFIEQIKEKKAELKNTIDELKNCKRELQLINIRIQMLNSGTASSSEPESGPADTTEFEAEREKLKRDIAKLDKNQQQLTAELEELQQLQRTNFLDGFFGHPGTDPKAYNLSDLPNYMQNASSGYLINHLKKMADANEPHQHFLNLMIPNTTVTIKQYLDKKLAKKGYLTAEDFNCAITEASMAARNNDIHAIQQHLSGVHQNTKKTYRVQRRYVNAVRVNVAADGNISLVSNENLLADDPYGTKSKLKDMSGKLASAYQDRSYNALQKRLDQLDPSNLSAENIQNLRAVLRAKDPLAKSKDKDAAKDELATAFPELMQEDTPTAMNLATHKPKFNNLQKIFIEIDAETKLEDLLKAIPQDTATATATAQATESPAAKHPAAKHDADNDTDSDSDDSDSTLQGMPSSWDAKPLSSPESSDDEDGEEQLATAEVLAENLDKEPAKRAKRSEHKKANSEPKEPTALEKFEQARKALQTLALNFATLTDDQQKAAMILFKRYCDNNPTASDDKKQNYVQNLVEDLSSQDCTPNHAQQAQAFSQNAFFTSRIREELFYAYLNQNCPEHLALSAKQKTDLTKQLLQEEPYKSAHIDEQTMAQLIELEATKMDNQANVLLLEKVLKLVHEHNFTNQRAHTKEEQKAKEYMIPFREQYFNKDGSFTDEMRKRESFRRIVVKLNLGQNDKITKNDISYLLFRQADHLTPAQARYRDALHHDIQTMSSRQFVNASNGNLTLQHSYANSKVVSHGASQEKSARPRPQEMSEQDINAMRRKLNLDKGKDPRFGNHNSEEAENLPPPLQRRTPGAK